MRTKHHLNGVIGKLSEGQALTALTLEHEQRASLPLGANILRVIGTDIVRIRNLPVLSGISKEGIAMAVATSSDTA